MSSRLKLHHLVIFLVAIFWLLAYTDSLSTMENRLQDRFYQERGQVDTRIVIVGIDDSSLEALGRWPWPRDYHARLIEAISQGNPAAIGIDLIFSEVAADLREDQALVRAAQVTEKIVLPAYGVFNERAEGGRLIPQALQEPFTELREKVSVGHINTFPDPDGVVRKTVLYYEYQGQKIKSFAWQLYQEYLRSSGEPFLELSQVPLDPLERMEVAFSGEPGDFEMVPYYQVLNGDIQPEYFRDRIVLVGTYTVGIDDYYFTPLAPEVPMQGVEIHANIIQNLLQGNFKRSLAFPGIFMILLLTGVAGFLACRRFSPGRSLLLVLLMLGGYLFAAGQLYKKGYILPLLYPLVLLAVIYLLALAYRYLEEILERKRITGVFGRYVAPQVVDKILKEGEAGLRLGGARREVTVLFVDIRGFTPLSESLTPEEVGEILNDYLSLCAGCIFEYGGTLDKFIGDAAMAIFNAPLDLEEHAWRAVQAAWAMQAGAGEMQARLQERFGRQVQFGIGINSGEAVVGNFGASFRMDYTAIGDTVNTAARLESNARPGQILISRSTYNQVVERVQATSLGEISVKGKGQGVEVFQLDGLKIS